MARRGERYFGLQAGLQPGLRHNKREAAIRQRRFWKHHIRDEADHAAHVRYCHMNPVKHGFVERPEDWPYSSTVSYTHLTLPTNREV